MAGRQKHQRRSNQGRSQRQHRAGQTRWHCRERRPRQCRVHTENPPPHQCRRWQSGVTVGTGTERANPQKNELAIHQNHKRGHIFARLVADSIPFSSNKLPEILDTFSLKPTSDEAEAMKKTIKECEEKGIKGEEKLCATSLESMVDFSTSMLGKDVKALSTNAENGEKKEYTIVGVTKMSSKKALVVCHRQEYAYAVFYCHKTDATVAHEVMMAAADGAKAAAVAVCHRDTAAWNPKHLAFQVLKVKPGAVPVCHFLPEDHIVWVPKY
ncbi:hypothetical protein DH2020_025336 [Rehmannia glutinosa]|uniref:BURP domain-containing protein n=1 Tax=Rehmannia glutinosa TaxID=99300 RepID=A0ABR0W2H4_REHGL